ncbi:MAG: GntR family transcriptional regulator [Clostridiales bacterium]|nr:GntR family transcriptional regulator [Clostridiales bacterium]
MIILDYQDRRPIYEQVSEKFRTLILSGALLPGSRMPSVRQLAMELSINPNTIQRAYMDLEQQGLIYPVKGKGNFVSRNEEIQRIGRRDYLLEFQALAEKGRDIGMEEEELIHVIRESYREGEND